MDWQEFRLANGIRVIYRLMPDFHSVAVGLWINVGSRFEDSNRSGISHFLEHLMFKGTKRRNYRQIKEAVEGVGGNLNGFTSEEITCYWIKILGKYLELSIDILSDMIQNSLLTKSDMEKEKKVIIEEINMYKDLPARYVHELFDQVLFPGHALGRSVLGTEETIRQMTRETLAGFVRTHYTPENIVLSVCGNFSEGVLKESSTRLLGRIGVGRRNRFASWKRKSRAGRIKLLYKDTEQVHFCLGGFGYSAFDPKRYPLAVLNTVLGGNMSSRLFDEVREKRGLAYDIRSYTKHYQDTGAFVISAGVAPPKAEEALKVIVEQIRKVKEKGIREREISRAKKFLVSQFLMSLEDNLEYMMWLGEQRTVRKELLSRGQIVDSINKVTRESVERVAGEIFRPDNLHLSLIGPEKNDQKLLTIIGQI